MYEHNVPQMLQAEFMEKFIAAGSITFDGHGDLQGDGVGDEEPGAYAEIL